MKYALIRLINKYRIFD